MSPSGYRKARQMKHYAHRKGGYAATPDGFDRSDSFTLASLIDEWFHRLEELNYAAKTVTTHTWSLKMFLRWAQERDLARPEQITKPILESYQRWLYRYRKPNDQPLSITTQRARLGSLKSFFAWLCKSNRLNANPAADLELPRKSQKRLPKALSLEEVHELLNLPDITDPLGIRDRTILELFYATGIRRSELVRIDVEDLDPGTGVLMIRKGKGGKDRVVPVGDRVLSWIDRYQNESRCLLQVSLNEHALFLTGYGERFSAQYIGNWVRRLLNQIDIKKEGSCHLLRHSCATHMLENGADIRYIQQLLGHARLDTTQIYTEVGILQLREVHARTHPNAKLNGSKKQD